MKVVAIIQARMGSTRLPGKVLKPLGDSCVLDYVVSRSKKIKEVDKVIVATTTLDNDLPIVNWCKENEVEYFRGSESDVLERYYECIKLYNPDYFIRITSDCPFVDYEMANGIIEVMKKNPSDYVKINGKECLPRGLGVEMFSVEALEYIFEHGKETRHREHVTYYGYEFHDEFKITEYTAPESLYHPNLRITLDTPEDYLLLQEVSKQIRDKWISSQKVLEFLLEKPEIAKINAEIKQKLVK